MGCWTMHNRQKIGIVAITSNAIPYNRFCTVLSWLVLVDNTNYTYVRQNSSSKTTNNSALSWLIFLKNNWGGIRRMASTEITRWSINLDFKRQPRLKNFLLTFKRRHYFCLKLQNTPFAHVMDGWTIYHGNLEDFF